LSCNDVKLPAHSASNDDEAGAFALFIFLAFLLGEGDTIHPFEGFFLGDGVAQKLAKLGRLVTASGSTIAALAATADKDATQDARIEGCSGRVTDAAKDCSFLPFDLVFMSRFAKSLSLTPPSMVKREVVNDSDFKLQLLSKTPTEILSIQKPVLSIQRVQGARKYAPLLPPPLSTPCPALPSLTTVGRLPKPTVGPYHLPGTIVQRSCQPVHFNNRKQSEVRIFQIPDLL
jgi:hypothetical protein